MRGPATRRSPELSASAARTVYRTKRRFVLGNLEAALSEEGPRPGAERKLSGREEALLVATACTKPADRAGALGPGVAGRRDVELTEHAGLSCETVRPRLTENDLKPWHRDMWCVPEIDGTCVARQRTTERPVAE